jgi:hypothetical protein
MKQAFCRPGLIVCIFVLSLILACAKPPTQEMAEAEKAISDAKAREADLYVQDVFAKAQDEFKKAGELVLAKKYVEAKASAMEAVKFAGQASSLIEQKRQEMKAELEAILPDVQKTMDETKKMAAAVIKKKASEANDELLAEIGKFEIDMTNIKEHLQTGKVRQSSDLAKTLAEKITAQKQRLTDMMSQKAAKK